MVQGHNGQQGRISMQSESLQKMIALRDDLKRKQGVVEAKCASLASLKAFALQELARAGIDLDPEDPDLTTKVIEMLRKSKDEIEACEAKLAEIDEALEAIGRES